MVVKGQISYSIMFLEVEELKLKKTVEETHFSLLFFDRRNKGLQELISSR